MRQLIKMVVCVCLWFGFAMPVSAKEVGQWENQHGQVVEVTADGQVKQVALSGGGWLGSRKCLSSSPKTVSSSKTGNTPLLASP